MRYKPTDEAQKVLDHLISKLTVTSESLNTKPEILDVDMEYTDWTMEIAAELNIDDMDCMNLLMELEGKECIYVNMDEPDVGTWVETVEIPTY